MFTIVMIIAVVILAVAWIAYGIYEMKMRAEEKKQPKQVSERLQQARSGVADWARKMASFKKPPYKGDQNEKSKS